MPEELLTYLERIQIRNVTWLAYVGRRGAEVQEMISRLRRFAAFKPGRVADACNARAAALQRRLNRILQKGE